MLVLLVAPFVWLAKEFAGPLMAAAAEVSCLMIETRELRMHKEEYRSLLEGKM